MKNEVNGGKRERETGCGGRTGVNRKLGPYRQSTPVRSIAWAFFAFIHEWVGSGGGTIKTIAHSLIPKRAPSPRCLSPTGPLHTSREKRKKFFFTWRTPHKTTKRKGERMKMNKNEIVQEKKNFPFLSKTGFLGNGFVWKTCDSNVAFFQKGGLPVIKAVKEKSQFFL